MASLSVVQHVFHAQKMGLVSRHLTQVKESGSSKIWMHQQNIIFVFLPVLKLVMETTVKVKNFSRMQVSMICPDFRIYHLGYVWKFKRCMNVTFPISTPFHNYMTHACLRLVKVNEICFEIVVAKTACRLSSST